MLLACYHSTLPLLKRPVLSTYAGGTRVWKKQRIWQKIKASIVSHEILTDPILPGTLKGQHKLKQNQTILVPLCNNSSGSDFHLIWIQWPKEEWRKDAQVPQERTYSIVFLHKSHAIHAHTTLHGQSAKYTCRNTNITIHTRRNNANLVCLFRLLPKSTPT